MSRQLFRNSQRCFNILRYAFFAITVLFTSISLGAQQADPSWPRTIQSESETIKVYQPQVDKWESGKLDARVAVVVTRMGGEAMYGAAWISARTTLDQQKRLVTLYDIDVTRSDFPSARNPYDSRQAASAISQWTFSIGLDRLLADMAITQSASESRNLTLGTTPPRIYVRESPAVLILIDGEPVTQKVGDMDFMRVINTPAAIVLDSSSGRYFLKGGEGCWMTAPDLKGPWTRTANPPKGLADLLMQEENGKQKTTVSAPNVTPEVIVSREPAELIQLDGEAKFSPIAATKLLYVTNTNSDLFLNISEQMYYALLSGRWFRSASLDGPWEFVPAEALPHDFALIPPDHLKAAVLASVLGTQQAQEAIVAAEVPQTATVSRTGTIFDSTYDGDPQFKPIDGTDMSYAVNSPDDVLLVAGKYYAVQDGVWFVSGDPMGPWTVCDMVPSDIYTIPPTSPLYFVTYAYVYDATPNYVYVGYTPGYFGAFIWDGVVVYGTGFWHPCWAYHYWWGCPWTWGFGWHYLNVGFGFRWTPFYPTDWYWYRWRDWGPHYPVWTPRLLYNRPIARLPRQISMTNLNAYDRWTGHGVISNHPVPLRPPVTGRSAPHVISRLPGVQQPDIYAQPDGHLYEHRSDGWYRRNGQTWERVGPAQPPPPQAGRPSTGPRPRTQPPAQSQPPRQVQPPVQQQTQSRTLEQLERERQARIQGTNRENQYRTPAPSAPRPQPARSAPRAQPAPQAPVQMPRGSGGGHR